MGMWDSRVVSVTPLQHTSMGNGTPAPGNMSAAIQTAQDAANKANNKRYKAQLGTYDTELANAKGQGTQALSRVDTQERNANSSGASSLISRGLYNSSSLNAENTRNTQNANDARQGINEGVARMSNDILSQKANAIGNRNDVGPDMSMFTALQQQAAAAGQVQPSNIRTQDGSINDPIQFGSGQQSSSVSPVNSMLSAYYNAGAGQGGGTALPPAPNYYNAAAQPANKGSVSISPSSGFPTAPNYYNAGGISVSPSGGGDNYAAEVAALQARYNGNVPADVMRQLQDKYTSSI